MAKITFSLYHFKSAQASSNRSAKCSLTERPDDKFLIVEQKHCPQVYHYPLRPLFRHQQYHEIHTTEKKNIVNIRFNHFHITNFLETKMLFLPDRCETA